MRTSDASQSYEACLFQDEINRAMRYARSRRAQYIRAGDMIGAARSAALVRALSARLPANAPQETPRAA